MTKKIFEKIYSGKVFDKNDLTPDEKKQLTALMGENGLSQTTVYLRFFVKGFSPWEIVGVEKIKNEFLLTHAPQCDGGEGNPEERGYGYVKMLEADNEPGAFSRIITDLRMATKFYQYMETLGMSIGTSSKRFREENWKPFEIIGLRATIEGSDLIK